jgi:hypothetical protein
MKKVKTINIKEIESHKPYMLLLNNNAFIGTGRQVKKRAKKYYHCIIYALPVEF